MINEIIDAGTIICIKIFIQQILIKVLQKSLPFYSIHYIGKGIMQMNRKIDKEQVLIKIVLQHFK